MRKGKLITQKMNYKKLYNNLINTRKNLQRKKKDGNFEKHHILPKSLGGDNSKKNIILLTPKEHFIAHLLLTKMYDGKNRAKMCYALFQMCRKNKKHSRIISASQYEYAKKLMSESCKGENGSFYGKKLSEESKKKLSERMLGNNNPSRKFGIWNKGLKLPPQTKESNKKRSLSLTGQKRSEESKLKMSLSAKGKPKSEEHKKNISKANIGKKLSLETRQKLSILRKGKKQTILTCPYCKKQGGTTMHRWHFDNCKMK